MIEEQEKEIAIRGDEWASTKTADRGGYYFAGLSEGYYNGYLEATKGLEAQLEQERNLSQCRFDHNEQLREIIKKARSIVHRLLVLIQNHKWWNYMVIDEARAFMSEVDRDKDHD